MSYTYLSNYMKINKLVILIIFIGLTGFNLSSTFDFNNPSITISSESIEETGTGTVVVFSVSLCSSESLEKFKITPTVKGLNSDSDLTYIFNRSTKQASVNYYYSVPEGTKDIGFTLELKDAVNETIVKKSIKLK